LITLPSDTAYHSFIGEVEALNTTTIRRLTPSCRHQLLAIAQTDLIRSTLAAANDAEVFVETWSGSAVAIVGLVVDEQMIVLRPARPLDEIAEEDPPPAAA
jgi:hypothetical protein